jgi:hypothetical protein
MTEVLVCYYERIRKIDKQIQRKLGPPQIRCHMMGTPSLLFHPLHFPLRSLFEISLHHPRNPTFSHLFFS